MSKGPRTEGSIQVPHGKLTVQVPRDLFVGEDLSVDEEKADSLRDTLRSRYPWLTDNGVDVILRNARRLMRDTIAREERGPVTGRRLISQGEVDKAISHMRSYLKDFPEDVDGWYVLGEALCKAGRSEDGYKAFNRARSLL